MKNFVLSVFIIFAAFAAKAGVSVQPGASGSGGGITNVAWGSINGTLSSQSDLNTALNMKALISYANEITTIITGNYTVLYTDNDHVFKVNSATNVTFTLNDGATNGFNFTAKNIGAGSITYTNNSGKTFDSFPFLTQPTGLIVHLIADGTNYFGGRLSPQNFVAANTVFAGPVSGTNQLPGMRALVAADLPASSAITAITGDVTATGPGSAAATLASAGTAGTYRSVTTDVKGRVTAGTAPTTFSGYAINDTSANLAAALTDETGTLKAVFSDSPLFSTQITLTNSTVATAPLVINDVAAGTGSRLQYNVGGVSKFAVDKDGVITSPSVVTVNNMTDTWNNGATVFTALKMNVTDTASSASSLLYDFQVGGVSKMKLGKSGILTAVQVSAGNITVTGAGSLNWMNSGGVDSTYVYVGTGKLQFGAGFSPDVVLQEAAVGNLKQGLDAAAPVAQTRSVANATGTDHDGATATFDMSQSTGTGKGGAFALRTSPSSTTGSTANALVRRLHIEPHGAALTGGSATLVFNITLASGKRAGFHIFATTMVTDGTDYQTATDEFTASAHNKAGTVTTAISSTIVGTTLSSSGTITTAWTAVANGNGIDFKNTETSTVITPTSRTCYWRAEIDTDDTAAAITAQ